ncbi:MAG: reverse transcriptase domain-containing protein [Candidatus Thiodiazotropha endolucinida]|nr:hypothetical protein [Candidatus Thiodiazotropha taylori]MCW4263710.1 reverse transcriptase domain-containing protein [Candidatus Thiodiazotropha endolucinida]
MKMVDVPILGSAARHRIGGQYTNIINCRVSMASRTMLVCLFLAVSSKTPDMAFSIYLNLIQDTQLDTGIHKKAVLGKHAAGNIKFTKRVLCCFFISTIWCTLMHILLSNDIHPNPGPENTSLSNTSVTYNTSLFSHNLSIIQLNIQSLIPKLDILETEMQYYDIVVLTETWLKPEHCDDDLRISNFDTPYRKDRTDRLGGGVAIYVKTGLNCICRPDLITGELEGLCIELIFKNHKLLVCGIYRPPNSPNAYWDLIDDTFDSMSNSGTRDIIIVGDFNNDMLNPLASTKMTNLISSYNFHQLVDEPTHYTENSSSVIDLVLVSKPENALYCDVISPFIPNLVRYHCPTVLYLKYRKPVSKTYKRHIWLYDRGDYNEYRHKLTQVNWDQVFVSNNINECADKLTDSILKAARATIPNKTVTIRPNEPEWINAQIKREIRKRKRLFKNAKRKNTTASWNKFKQKRNEVTLLTRNAKKQYKDKLINDLINSNTNSKRWHRLVKQIIAPQNNTQPIQFLEIGDEIVQTDHEIAETLNTYFLEQSTLDDSHAFIPECHPPNYELLENVYITNDDVKEAISLVKSNKAPGPDHISPRLFKEGANELIPQLRKLFNLSLAVREFPVSWKTSNLTAVHKKDSRSNPGNYRPISLLNYAGKLMERCIHKHVSNYLIEHSVITPFQSGFQSGDSTVNQLLYICNEISNALDNNKELRIVFLDISKAFDRVWHKGLLFKLKSVGISGELLDWFNNYLSDRYQRVCIRNVTSSWKKIAAGVPQGSILGPLLFIIFINDIVNDINSSIRLFADDTCIFEIVDDPVASAAILNDDLKKILAWAKQWLVLFNALKTEVLLVSKKRIKLFHPPLIMGDTQIKEVSRHKHLGLMISSDFSWNDHLKSIQDKTYKRLGALRRHKFNLDRCSLLKLYITFVRPLIEYGDIIWDNCSLENKRNLENIQLDAARIFTGATKLCSTQKLYDDTCLEPLSSRRGNHKLCQLYKMVNNLTPPYLQQLIPQRVQEQTRYSLRNITNFVIPASRTTHHFNSFLPSTLREWNMLDHDIKESASLQVFKHKINPQVRIPPIYFNTIQTSRRGQILHTRLRLECSSLKQHLYNKNLVESPLCSCGVPETSFHFLLSCINYSDLRQRYFSGLGLRLTVDILLNGKTDENISVNNAIFRRVQLYILATKRFD